MKALRILIVCVLALVLVFAFNSRMIDAGLKHHVSIKPVSTFISIKKDTSLYIHKTRVDIRIPIGAIKGDLLLLPGWDFPTRFWCDSTNICKTALKAGYRIIMPDMQKNVYATQYYKETRSDMAAQPTRTWLTDTCIATLKNVYGIFATPNNYVIGISTGGRGVALVCAYTGSLFKAGAALSGDYDQTIETNDPLMIYTYGTYDTQKERWNKVDNAYYLLSQVKTPLYIAYGSNDKVVPPLQSEHYYQKLKKLQPASTLKVYKGEGHNFHFWKQAADSGWNYMMSK